MADGVFREDVVDVGDYEIRDLFSDSCSDESESSGMHIYARPSTTTTTTTPTTSVQHQQERLQRRGTKTHRLPLIININKIVVHMLPSLRRSSIFEKNNIPLFGKS
ncbi:hypothetical protein Scep_001073 [Stephania cephalantha]|uniref:Uncharacterized protein n=1 Tax=Stephania cephalantha TaxID=152367 RepID=A0AAP0L790_9MAGN